MNRDPGKKQMERRRDGETERRTTHCYGFSLHLSVSPSLCLFALTSLILALAGCESPAGTKSGTNQPLFSSAPTTTERWTIRCMRSEAPGHAEYARNLAEQLKQVQGLRAKDVRVVTDAKGSTIYYGEYVKAASQQSGRLVFPPQFQRDIEQIRALGTGQAQPFFYAEPEPMEKPGVAAGGEWDVSNAKGAYTLQIAVFYNTPTFSQRQEAANEYVRLLREAGYTAYCRHETLRSYVFAGDFEQTDIVVNNDVQQLGPRVEQFIARNEAEFRHISENGQIIKRKMPNGQMLAPLSYLVPVPRGEGAPKPR